MKSSLSEAQVCLSGQFMLSDWRCKHAAFRSALSSAIYRNPFLGFLGSHNSINNNHS